MFPEVFLLRREVCRLRDCARLVLLLAGMAKAARRRANNVLKYLRWRSTSPEGEVAEGF